MIERIRQANEEPKIRMKRAVEKLASAYCIRGCAWINNLGGFSTVQS